MLALLTGLLFKKKTETHKLLSFNVDALREKREELALSLYHHRADDSWKIVKELIEVTANLEALSVTFLKDPNSHAFQSGRFTALVDFKNLLEQAFDPEFRKERGKKEQVKKTLPLRPRERPLGSVI